MAQPPDDSPSEPRFRVMRQDDHGNRFEVARTGSRAEADVLVEEYTRRLHHQIYWVEPLEAC